MQRDWTDSHGRGRRCALLNRAKHEPRCTSFRAQRPRPKRTSNSRKGVFLGQKPYPNGSQPTKFNSAGGRTRQVRFRTPKLEKSTFHLPKPSESWSLKRKQSDFYVFRSKRARKLLSESGSRLRAMVGVAEGAPAPQQLQKSGVCWQTCFGESFAELWPARRQQERSFLLSSEPKL